MDDDGDATKSGILALAKSPDGALVVIVSPVKIIVMTSAWDIVGEVKVIGEGGEQCIAADASVSWRGDGAYFVGSMRDSSGVPYMRIVDRDVEEVVRAEVEEALKVVGDGLALGGAVAWQPRVGGIVCFSGPGGAVAVFERNGLRHLRNDIGLPTDNESCSNALPSLLEWSCDSSMLAVPVVVDIEVAMFEQLKGVSQDYKIKFRELKFNLSDSKNRELREELLSGSLQPAEVVRLTSKDLANAEKKEERRKMHEHNLREAAAGNKEEAITKEFLCGKCKKRECTYFQMQTGGADEPLTTFVHCVNCDNRWRF